MGNTKFGEKLQELRKKMGYSQKDFAEFLEIPRSSMSAYENDHNSPTMDVLINVANKCNVSLDWLCGLSSSQNNISSLGDITNFLFKLLEIEEIGLEIDVHRQNYGLLTEDGANNKNETKYAQITVYADDRRYSCNEALVNIIDHIKNVYTDLESYSISKESYDLFKPKLVNQYNLPLTQKQYTELSHTERIERHAEYIKEELERIQKKSKK